MSAVAPTLEAFFTDRLIGQRQASPHTVAAYRDTLASCSASPPTRIGKPPVALDFADLDAPLIGAFLNHLEDDRDNSVRTRNARLAAIHSLFRYAALDTPSTPRSIQRVLAIPQKRCERGTRHVPHQRRNRTHCSTAPTAAAGSADETTRCSPWRSAPAYGSVNSSRSNAPTSCWPAAPTSVATARAASSACTPLTAQASPRCSAWLARTRRPTSRTAVPDPTRRAAQRRCGAMPRRQIRQARRHNVPVDRDQARHTPRAPPHLRHVPAWRRNRHLHHRPLARPRTHRAPHRSTCTPTSPSKRRPSPSPPRPEPRPGATNPQTRSSPSSKRCEYAEHHGHNPPPTRSRRHLPGIIAASA